MKQKLYFICSENKEPIGGIKQLYRHVDILNKNGFNAFIVHRKKGFRHKWFENNTIIIYNSAIFNKIDKILKKKIKPLKKIKNYIRSKKDNLIDDKGILIIPEIFGPYIDSINDNIKKVIFNQNCYYTFNNCSFDESKSNPIYLDEKFLASIVVSEDSKKYLEYTFPKSITHRIHLGINTDKFSYKKALKKKQIAFMPRKLKDDIIQIINILKVKGNLKNWEFVPIHNKSEDEVATILNESSIFLSLNHREGFGLPPAEAMASGCIVIGYAGQGGNEYFKPEFSFKIDESNIIQFVEKVEEIALMVDTNDANLIKIQENASIYISEHYNLKKEEESIISTWNKILNKI